MFSLIVVHNNGIDGQRGYTEYSFAEVENLGGIESIKIDYAKHGIVIYDAFTSAE